MIVLLLLQLLGVALTGVAAAWLTVSQIIYPLFAAVRGDSHRANTWFLLALAVALALLVFQLLAYGWWTP